MSRVGACDGAAGRVHGEMVLFVGRCWRIGIVRLLERWVIGVEIQFGVFGRG